MIVWTAMVWSGTEEKGDYVAVGTAGTRIHAEESLDGWIRDTGYPRWMYALGYRDVPDWDVVRLV